MGRPAASTSCNGQADRIGHTITPSGTVPSVSVTDELSAAVVALSLGWDALELALLEIEAADG